MRAASARDRRRLALHPDAVELQVEHAFLHQDELVLRRMHVHGYELPGIAVGFEGEGGIGHRFREIDLTENVPGLAAYPLPFGVMPFSSAAMMSSCR